MKKLTYHQITKNLPGFTLLEILVVMAILGILIGVASSVFISVLRSQNKTQVINEVRQNADLVINLIERDVRDASNLSPPSGNTLTITRDSGDIIWTCVPEGANNNGHFTRDIGSGPETVTNDDTLRGVSVDCTGGVFDVTGSTSFIVRVRFSMNQGVDAPTRNDFNINLPFETTVGTRSF